MSQTPITVNYTLEQVLTKLDQRLDKIESKIDKIQTDVTDLKIGQAKMETEINGLNKRLENQEFVNRGILIALVVAILGSAAKLLGWVGNP